ncbi:MAG: hypothetical protein QOH60_4642 [Mycobacterium sp.]|jgi:uncharacterized protein YcnI|nr:hypothetical protein [Mycobacterium sp.]
MTRISRALPRALISAVALPAVITVGMITGTGLASAHVVVEAEHPAPGKWAVITFEVPNESENGSLTTQLNVALPQGTPASVETMPGWTAKLDGDVAAGTVRSVTWTAAPGTGIPVEQFALFRLSVKLPNTDKATFPAAQTYSDGTVVKWDQPDTPNGGEPEHPVPTLELSAQTQQPERDSTALWLAIAGLVVGSVGVVLAVLRFRRGT